MTETSKVFDGERVIHEVDGIMECDNRLPRWWLFTFFGAVIFSAFYWLGYHSFGVIDSTQVAFEKAKEAKAEADAQKLRSMGEVTNESLLTMSKNEAITLSGRATFAANCVTCHGENAQGNIGPNLTDSYWLHGGKPTNIYRTVHDGWPDKGMKSWIADLGEEKLREVVAYVISIRNTNVPGKAPQGDPEPPY